MNLLNFFRKPRKLVLIRRFSSRIRLAEWRADRDLVKQAREFLVDPKFATIVDVLRNESPINFVHVGRFGLEERAVEHARMEGYQLCLNNLEAMGSFAETREIPEPTFEQDNQEET